jgi:hypothetical protein
MRRRALFVSLLALLASGCTLSYRYDPLDESGTVVEEWSTTIGKARFSAKLFSVPTGYSFAYGSLTVENKSSDNVSILAAKLETNGRTLDEGQDKLDTILPGRTETVSRPVQFPEGMQASKVMGPSATWIWRVRIGENEHTIRVNMKKR